MSNVRVFRAQKALGPIKDAEGIWYVAALLLEQDGRSTEQVTAALGERPGEPEKSLSVIAGYCPAQLGEPVPSALTTIIDAVKEMVAPQVQQPVQPRPAQAQQHLVVESRADADRAARLFVCGGVRMPKQADQPWSAMYPHTALSTDRTTWHRHVDALFHLLSLADHQREKVSRLTAIMEEWLDRHSMHGLADCKANDVRTYLSAAEMLLEIRTTTLHFPHVAQAGASFWEAVAKMWHTREIDYYDACSKVREAVNKILKPGDKTPKNHSFRI